MQGCGDEVRPILTQAREGADFERSRQMQQIVGHSRENYQIHSCMPK